MALKHVYYHVRNEPRLTLTLTLNSIKIKKKVVKWPMWTPTSAKKAIFHAKYKVGDDRGTLKLHIILCKV